MQVEATEFVTDAEDRLRRRSSPLRPREKHINFGVDLAKKAARAYNTLPFLYKDSANDAFHEAIGDTIALSITPGYLVKIGLLDKEPPVSDADISFLLREALDKSLLRRGHAR